MISGIYVIEVTFILCICFKWHTLCPLKEALKCAKFYFIHQVFIHVMLLLGC